MSTPPEVYTRINDYIDGRLTAAELESWLAPFERSILHEPDSDLSHAVLLVELALADMDNGQSEATTKAFLRRKLGDLLRTNLAFPLTGS